MSRAHDHHPPPELAACVAALWSFDTAADGRGAFRVLPDGSTDLLLRFDDVSPGEPAPPPTVYVVGPADTYDVFEPPPAARFLGVRLRPGAAGAFLRASPAGLTNRLVPVGECAPHLSGLRDRLSGWVTFGEGFSALSAALLAAAPKAPLPAPVVRAVELLAGDGTAARVAAVARAVGLTERTLHRRLLAATGYAPKALARVLRFQRAVAALRSGADPCCVALACGYADQSHMCREVRDLSGLSPTGHRV